MHWFQAAFLPLILAAALVDARAAGEQGAQALIAGDYFAAGDILQPEEPIEGDAFLAGGEISLQVPVDGDAVLSGGRVSVSGRVGADLYAAGGNLTVDAAVLHNARLAGGRVHLSRRSEIAGRATVAAGDVLAEGAVAGQLAIFAQSVTIDGRFGGGIAVVARSLKVGPGARIQGRLTYRTELPPVIDPGAEIVGGVKQSDVQIVRPGPGPWGRAVAWIGAVIFTGGVFLLGTLAILIAPTATAVTSARIRGQPLAAFAVGAAVTILLPVAALLFIATVIALPLGFALLLLWPVALLLGYLGGVVFAGDSLAMLFARVGDKPASWTRIACLAAALSGVLVSVRWPLFGSLLIVALSLLGAGALALSRFGTRQLRGTYKKERTAFAVRRTLR
jgi:cytoskeletal protein CcmA (bactofilin family)